MLGIDWSAVFSITVAGGNHCEIMAVQVVVLTLMPHQNDLNDLNKTTERTIVQTCPALVSSGHHSCRHLWPLLLTWMNFNPSMNRELHPLKCVGWNHLSIPWLQQCNRWSLGLDMLFHPTLLDGFRSYFNLVCSHQNFVNFDYLIGNLLDILPQITSNHITDPRKELAMSKTPKIEVLSIVISWHSHIEY